MSWKNPSKFFQSFPVRLALIVALTAALASVLVSLLIFGYLLKGFNDQDRMELDSRLLSYWAAGQYGGVTALLSRATGDVKSHGGRPFLLQITNPEGEMEGAIVPGGWELFDLADPVLQSLSPGTYFNLRNENLPYSLVVTGAELEDGTRVLVGVSTENRQFLMQMYQSSYPWALILLVMAGAGVGLIASRRLLLPIRSLNKEIDRIIVTGELNHRLEGRGTEDPFDELMDRYNRLLDRVESLIGGMRETLDAVAHDLRTPLTRLRGHAELALRTGRPEEYEEALAVVVEQTDQAVDLLSGLMDIAEAEQGMLSLDVQNCDLRELAGQVVEMYSFIAEEREQTIHFDAPEPLPTIADPVQIRRILGNLIDNALKYSPESGAVDVACYSNEQFCILTVTDDGPGVPESESHRVFERLYRGDKSRGSRGLGLGLSMVKALVSAHGGTVSVEKAVERGAIFRVEIPFVSKG
ncbi:MAG: HAMP domain-containing histidine kinase [Spirochaetales bacterium]|nr:HAMP domain-containing histidine kinase [Spirochaetales bacterium]